MHETKSKELLVNVEGISQGKQIFMPGEYETLPLGQWLEGLGMTPSTAIEVMPFLLNLVYLISRL